jgi:hypothetical protein
MRCSSGAIRHKVAMLAESENLTRPQFEEVRPGMFSLSHSGLISKFLAYPFPFRDRLP